MNGEILLLCTMEPITCPECGNEFKDEPSDDCYDETVCDGACEYGRIVYMECEAQARSGRKYDDIIECECGWWKRVTDDIH